MYTCLNNEKLKNDQFKQYIAYSLLHLTCIFFYFSISHASSSTILISTIKFHVKLIIKF